MDLSIVPECFIDTNLAESLVPPLGRGYNHQKGCGTVARTMQNQLANQFAFGIIDKDKKELDYLKEFSELVTTDRLCLWKHASRPHYFLQIKPAMEQFILEVSQDAGQSLPDFGLPADLELLKKVTKTEQSKKDPRFKRLFKAILQAGSPEMALISKWLLLARTQPYSFASLASNP